MDQWRRQARIIHLAMIGGAVAAWAMFAVLRVSGLDLPGARPVAWVLTLTALAVLAGAAAAASVLGRRLERSPAEDDETWRRRALASLVVTWALAEGAAVVAGVAWLLGGGSWTVAVAGAGLLVLAVNAPGRRLT